MTISLPQTAPAGLSRLAVKFAVLLGPDDGSDPSEDDEVDYLELVSIARFAGSRTDSITLRYNMAKAEVRLVDTTVPVEHNRMIEVREVADDGDLTRIVARGRLFGQPQILSQDEESVTILVEFDKALFGGKNLREVPYYDPIDDEGGGTSTKLLNRPLIFNPEIDQILEANRADRTDDDLGLDSLFIDPESLRTGAATTLQGIGTAELWTFAEAVQLLCALLNPDETHVTNPTLDELAGQFANVDDDLLKNQPIDFGSSLPDALDQLLAPYRLSWYLAHEVDDADPAAPVTKTTLQFFQNGEGVRHAVYAQRPGEATNVDETNVSDVSTQFALDLFNRIECSTSRILREGTFELSKGWSDADDSLDVYELEETQPLAQQKPDVGRKFVLNEAGDYIGLRAEISTHFDLRDLLGAETITRRRKFLPCISEYDAGRSNRFVVEWENPDLDEEGSQWEVVPWAYSVLEQECGIRFDGPTPPEALMALLNEDHTTVKIRITAAIEGDTRTWGIAERQETSPSGLDLTLTLNLEDRFHDRQILSVGGTPDQTSIFLGTTADEVDDTDAIQEYAEKLREIEDVGDVSASIVLEGVDHPEYLISHLIEKVEGRNLTLNARNPAAGDPRPPQIVGLKWHLQGGQSLELLLETFQEERPEVRS